MTEDQIREAIRVGLPFLAVTPHGDILARYMPLGPVFKWEKNRMLPLPLQGDDLSSWLQEPDQDGRPAKPDDTA
jgi:hypothetical protein